MNQLTLRQLRYFDALARMGHFGQAAEQCSVTQPALSMQIKELEHALGAALIERGARGVRLTAFGEDMLPRVRDILRGVDELGDVARAAREGRMGRLRIGVIPTIAPYLLPGVLRALGEAHPGLDVHVRETLTHRLVTDLHEGRIDAAIVALPVSEPGVEELALFTEPFVLVRPASEAAPEASIDALLDERLLLLEEGHCFRDQALAFCGLPGARARDGLDGSSFSTLVQMVGAGLGVTLLPQIAVNVEARSAPVSVARFRGAEPSRTVGLIWRKGGPLAGQMPALADTVRRAAERLTP